jgi:transposase
MREMLNVIFYVLRSGCPWQLLPEHLPPHQTTYRWLARFRDDGLWKSLNHHLVMLDHERVGRRDRQSIGQDHGKRRSARV